MGLTKKAAITLAYLTTFTAIGVGVTRGINYAMNYIVTNENKFRKVDGILSYTNLYQRKDGSINCIARRKGFRDSIQYFDYNGDKLVDKIFKENQVLEREKDFKKYQKTFKNADRDFREQIKRFKPMMNR